MPKRYQSYCANIKRVDEYQKRHYTSGRGKLNQGCYATEVSELLCWYQRGQSLIKDVICKKVIRSE